jgi:phosphomannomutase
MSPLADRVRAWIGADPDPAARAELQTLLDTGNEPELEDRFARSLAFGTAGLRGPLRAGPNGMNAAVVRRAAAGLAAYLLERSRSPGVIIGYDARHGSARFALETARIMAGAGLRVELLPEPLPTPVLAYAVRSRGRDAGVMVTASHNPAGDNGYKVYLGGPDGGAQLVSPADTEIEAAIAAAAPANALPESGVYTTLGPELAQAYVDAIVALSLTPERDVRIAYTPLHGVGGRIMQEAFATAGFPAPAVVAAQAEPDPDFPTVPFPNPEEPGATDLLLQLAADTQADLAIANDPDADRCAVAVDGRLLTGDELGLLLADHVLAHAPPGAFVATTIVSSAALAALAAARGAHCGTTLTGFKWLTRAAGSDGSGNFVFAYEEALGYAVGLDVVRDKDGISAALAAAELAAALKVSGRTLRDRLDELATEIGLHATRQISVGLDRPDAGERVVELLCTAVPESFAGRRVRRVADLMHPSDGLPPTQGVRLDLDGGRIVVRPSGTEPKLKAYLEVVVPAAAFAADPQGSRARADETLARIADELRPLLAPGTVASDPRPASEP